MKSLFISLFLILISHSGIAHEQLGISVSGKASISKVPDQFLIRLSISERNVSASKAKQRVDLLSKQVLTAIKSYGVKDSAIKSTQLRINPIYHKNRNVVDKVYVPINQNSDKNIASVKMNNQTGREVNVEFDVSRDIEVKISDFGVYEKMLDRVTNLGVTRISPVQSSISDAETLYQGALELAVTNAQEKAKKLAEQLNVTLGNVNSIEELSHRAPGKMHMASEGRVAGARMPSYTGLNEVSAEVRVTFAISPQ